MEDLGVVDGINNAGSWLVRNQALLLSYASISWRPSRLLSSGMIVARIVSNALNRVMRRVILMQR